MRATATQMHARERLERAAGLRGLGWRQADIARELGVTQPRVSAMLAEARELGLLDERSHRPVRRAVSGLAPADGGAAGELSPAARAALISRRLNAQAQVALNKTGTAFGLKDLAEHAADLSAMAMWAWDRVSAPEWDSDRWYAADVQELLGEDVARTLVWVQRAAERMGLDVEATRDSGEPVWRDDRRRAAAAERAVVEMASPDERRAASVPAIAAATGVPASQIPAVIRAARSMPSGRWRPAHGVQPLMTRPAVGA